ncbi:WD40 repeat domain-containing protein [Thiomonas sp.]
MASQKPIPPAEETKPTGSRRLQMEEGGVMKISHSVKERGSRRMRSIFLPLLALVLALVLWPSPGTAGGMFSGLSDFFHGTKSIARAKAEFDLSPYGASVLDWSPDGKFLAVSGILNPYVMVFDIQSKKRVMTLRKLAGGSHGLAYSPDGRYLAAGQAFTQWLQGVSVMIWDAKSGALVKSLTGPFPPDKPANSVTYLAFSPDGRYLAVGYDGNFRHPRDNIYLYDTRTWAPVRSFGDAKDIIHGGLLFSPDGRHLAHGTLEGDIRIWDVASGRLVRAIRAYSNEAYKKRSNSKNSNDVESLAYSPDGKQIVTGTDTGSEYGHLNEATGEFVTGKNNEQVKVWRVTGKGELIRTIDGFTTSVGTIAFSHDGKYLVTGSDDKKVKVWDTHTWRVLETFTASDAPMSADFSPDSNYLAVGSGVIAKVWEFKK